MAFVRCRKCRGGTPPDERAAPSARPHRATMRTEALRVCRRPAVLFDFFGRAVSVIDVARMSEAISGIGIPACRWRSCGFIGRTHDRAAAGNHRRRPMTGSRSGFFTRRTSLRVVPAKLGRNRVARTMSPAAGNCPTDICYSAAIRSPWMPLAIRSPTAWSMLRQYSIARARTGSVTPFLRWPTTLETSRSRWALSMTLRTSVPG